MHSLTTEDYEGIIDDLSDFCNRNSSKPDIVEFIKWVKNDDNTYSKLFVVVLANGSETGLVTNWALDKKEYFMRKLKHG